ncbi:hypothetical protein [Flavobacterium arundinis]
MYDTSTPYLVKTMAEIAVWIFCISFGIGTLLLLTYIIDGYGNDYMFAGFLYVVAATFVNTIALCVLLIHAYIYYEYRRSLLKWAALLLANVPIAILYMYIVFEILPHYGRF